MIGIPYVIKDDKGRSRRVVDVACSDCGTLFTTRTDSKTTGICKKCTYNYRNSRPNSHGLSGHRLYSIWDHMVQRTCNEKSDSYINYGARGITICDAWRTNFITFYEWAIDNGYHETLSIDRIDVNKGYSPDNCRFADTKTQARNTRVLQKNNTSGYRGVSFNKMINKYTAEITVDYKKIVIGNFDDPVHAAMAYDTFVIVYGLQHNQNFNNKVPA